MPFDYEQYRNKCDGMSTEQLHKEWENYTRQIASGATGTATSVLLGPLTAGVSLVGLGINAPRIHNARKKRVIIEAGLKSRGTTHHTRTRDVLGPMAVSGAISGLTLGCVAPGVDGLAGDALSLGQSVDFVAINTALDIASSCVAPAIVSSVDEKPNKKSDEKLKIQNNNTQLLLQQNIHQEFHVPTLPPGLSEVRPMLHTAQTWPQELGYLAKAGPMAVPYHEDESVLLLQPALHQQQLNPPTFQHIPPTYIVPRPLSMISSEETSASSISCYSLSQGNATPDTNSSAGLSAAEQQILFLQRRILELELEKRGSGTPNPDAGVGQDQPQLLTQRLGGQTQMLVQCEPTALVIAEENQVHSYLTTTPQLSSKSLPEEEVPILPPRPSHRSSILPTTIDSPGSSPPTTRDMLEPSTQELPAYIELASIHPSQARPRLPQHQLRQDSGYYSVYSTTSSTSIPCSSPQSYIMTDGLFIPQVATPQSHLVPQPILSSEIITPQSSTPQTATPATRIERTPITSHAEPTLHRQAHVKRSARARGQGRHASEPSISHNQPSAPCSISTSASTPIPLESPSATPPYPSPALSTVAAIIPSAIPTTDEGYFVTNSTPTTSAPISAQSPASKMMEKYQPGLKNQGQNLMKGWKWAKNVTVAALPVSTPGEKKVLALQQEPDYGPPPAIPPAWK